MKKLIQKISFASLMLFAMTAGNAYAEVPDYTQNICKLVKEMGTLFGTLRTLAFIGAAFIIAGWAWGYISAGKIELKDVKEKGIGMLVGFILLFSIGVIVSIFMPGNGVCPDAFKAW